MDGFNLIGDDTDSADEHISSTKQHMMRMPSFDNESLGLDMLIGNKYKDTVSPRDTPANNNAHGFHSERNNNEADDIESEDDNRTINSSEYEDTSRNKDTGESHFGFRPQNKPSYLNDIPLAPEPTREEVDKEKAMILYQLERLEKKGIKLPRRFTMDSSLSEMKTEYERIKQDREVDASVKFSKKMLQAFASGVEFLNNKFDPFDVKLNGWSESIHDSLDDYDEVFEDLHFKYRTKTKIMPEIKLLMMVGSSAFMFHLTNTMFSSAMPQMGDVLKNNPDLRRQFAQATASTMAASGSDPTGMSSMFANVFSEPVAQNERPVHAPPPPRMHTMNGPPNLDAILNDIDNNNRIETMSTATPSEISEMTDTNSLRNLVGNRRSKRTPKKTLDIA